ncbi:hypothetical protein LCGC14_2290050 [marine sediment metagenome]|uniref:Uncharacterized protein n=1 Tax=marine sediment metagenome TaxID=412755 RepID=A0A0F9FLS0_9ZZZZ
MDEVECMDCLNRSIKFTTGSVLLKWMKLDDEKLENYILKHFFYKNLGGSAINVTEFFLIDLSKKYKFTEDEVDGLRYVLNLRFGNIVLDFKNHGILKKE